MTKNKSNLFCTNNFSFVKKSFKLLTLSKRVITGSVWAMFLTYFVCLFFLCRRCSIVIIQVTPMLYINFIHKFYTCYEWTELFRKAMFHSEVIFISLSFCNIFATLFTVFFCWICLLQTQFSWIAITSLNIGLSIINVRPCLFLAVIVCLLLRSVNKVFEVTAFNASFLFVFFQNCWVTNWL